MYEWSEEHQMVRQAIRQFIEKEIKPNLEELEHGDTPPYDVLRKLFRTFGMDAMARDGFERQIAREKAEARGEPVPERGEGGRGGDGGGDHVEGHDRAEGTVGGRPADDGQDRGVGDHRAQLGV